MTVSKKVTVTDTILRDAHQSLLATRMRTEDMLPICDKLDQVGYWSLEVWGGATFDACVRFLKEDPWERLRKLKAALPNTRLQMLLRGQNLLGYRHYSDDVVRAFVAKAAVNGIDVFRIFDAMNDVRNLRVSIEAVKAAGKHAQGTIAYTTSPVHTIDAFVAQGKAMADMGVDSIAIKDMAGLLTPYATGELVKALKDALPLDVVVHSHDTAGVASMCQLKAVENGADRIDTAISSMAWGTRGLKGSSPTTVWPFCAARARMAVASSGLRSALLIHTATGMRKWAQSSATRVKSCFPAGVGSTTATARSAPERELITGQPTPGEPSQSSQSSPR